MKIEKFTNRYPVSKTIRFRLIPQAETMSNMEKDSVLKKDEAREEDFIKIKELIDEYHKKFIDDSLKCIRLDNLSRYNELYLKSSKTENEKEELEEIIKGMMLHISYNFAEQEDYKKLFGKEMINELLPEIADDENDMRLIESFSQFTTYFTGFNNNRKNIYTGEGKVTEVANRLIVENLPKFINNCSIWNDLNRCLDKDAIDEIRKTYKTADDFFIAENYDRFLRQKDIDSYNAVIGGVSKEDGLKIKGINEYINEFNQHNQNIRIRKMDFLYKQILSDASSSSFRYDEFSDDKEVIGSLFDLMEKSNENTGISIRQAIESADIIFSKLEEYNPELIFIKNDTAITGISNSITGDWASIREEIAKEYNEQNPIKKKENIEKYNEKRTARLNSIKHYSISDLEKYLKSENAVAKYLMEESSRYLNDIKKSYNKVSGPLKTYDRKLGKDDETVDLIRVYLESILSFIRFMNIFDDDLLLEYDRSFYSELSIIKDTFFPAIQIYNKVRNYITKKPYSRNKIKLTFDNSQLLGGWDRNKEADYCSVILRKGNSYYLGIIKKEFNKVLQKYPEPKEGDECYQKMIYKLLPDPSKMLPKVFFSKKGIKNFHPSEEILEIYNKKSFKKGNTFKIDDCRKLIDFYKESINQYGDWNEFGFRFSDTDSYMNISEFFSEVKNQGYKIRFTSITKKYVDELVKGGRIYLFKIYSKDFSAYSKGNKNLHTLYFEMLFDENNLKDTVYALNGGAEVFYRKPSLSLSETTIHKAGTPIQNKNRFNRKGSSVFDYDIIKDRRFTDTQFFLHVPLTISFKASAGTDLNNDVRYELKESSECTVIGIDRGERNLLYISVIDQKGKILEQRSLNEIINHTKDTEYVTDYHQLLDDKENRRNDARREWKTIENIKELKEGYISQVVHVVVGLVEKYNAVIAMEDLNTGFKNSRIKVEKQVYQKFEKMLIDKLNLYVNKQKDVNEYGGLLKPYQLTNKFESFEKMGRQNGIIFYVPAWLTSKIDPATGFVDLIKPKYKSIDESKKLIGQFNDISYVPGEDLFRFHVDYSKFENGSVSFKKEWQLYSYGKRIKSQRNHENRWESTEIDLTEEFKNLFEEYQLDINAKDLKQKILSIDDKPFHERLIKLLSLMLQLRNNITGTDIDYIVSPVKNKNGFFDSNKIRNSNDYPIDADANGAYHIALKALWIINQLKNCDDISKIKLTIKNSEWLEYVQNR